MTTFESEIFHEHVNMSGIVLIHNSSFSPVHSADQCFDAFHWVRADDFRFDWVHLHFSLEICELICHTVTMKSSPCVIPEILCSFKTKHIFRAGTQLLMCSCQSLFQVHAPSRVTCMRSHQSKFPSVDALSVRHWQSDQHGSLSFCVKVRT